MMRRSQRDDGYAALAAVLAAACFALLAAQVARTSRSGVAGVNAGMVHARLSAAADAGLAIALDHVLADDASVRWGIGGETYETPFGASDLTIRIEDESGKIPLNRMSEDQARTMFQLAGADGEVTGALTAAFMDWRNPDKVGTAAPGALLQAGGGSFHAVQELRRLPGMTPGVYAAIAPFASVDAGDVRFEPQTASPFALKTMAGSAAKGAVSTLEQLRTAAGEKTAFEQPPPVGLVGRVLTVRVQAADAQGGRVEDAAIVQVTGRTDEPYIVRQHYVVETDAG